MSPKNGHGTVTAWRIPGEFVPCDVNLSNDPKILRAGPLPELLFRRANEYVKRVNRDGTLDRVELPIVAFGIPGKPAAHAAVLVREGLWDETPDGWLIRSFTKWNPTLAAQGEIRKKRRLGAIKTNHARGRHAGQPDPECPLCTEGTTR